MSDLSARILPDLRAGRMIVRFGIEMVVKLVGLKRSGDFRRKPIRDAVVRFGGIGGNVRRRNHDVGAVRAQADRSFRATSYRALPECSGIRESRRPSPGRVPVLPLVGSTIVPPGLEQALALGGVEHGDGGAVLDAAAGIHVLDLGKHETGRAVDDFVQPYERRVADRLESVVAINEAGRVGATRRGLP